MVHMKLQLSEYDMIWEKTSEQRLLFLDLHKTKGQENQGPWIDNMERKRPRKEYRWLYLLCMSLDSNINKTLDAGSPGFIILILYLIAPGPKQDNLKKKHHKLLGKSTQMMMKKKWFILQRKEEVIHQDGFLIQMKTSWCLKM